MPFYQEVPRGTRVRFADPRGCDLDGEEFTTGVDDGASRRGIPVSLHRDCIVEIIATTEVAPVAPNTDEWKYVPLERPRVVPAQPGVSLPVIPCDLITRSGKRWPTSDALDSLDSAWGGLPKELRSNGCDPPAFLDHMFLVRKLWHHRMGNIWVLAHRKMAMIMAVSDRLSCVSGWVTPSGGLRLYNSTGREFAWSGNRGDYMYDDVAKEISEDTELLARLKAWYYDVETDPSAL